MRICIYTHICTHKPMCSTARVPGEAMREGRAGQMPRSHCTLSPAGPRFPRDEPKQYWILFKGARSLLSFILGSLASFFRGRLCLLFWCRFCLFPCSEATVSNHRCFGWTSPRSVSGPVNAPDNDFKPRNQTNKNLLLLEFTPSKVFHQGFGLA